VNGLTKDPCMSVATGSVVANCKTTDDGMGGKCCLITGAAKSTYGSDGTGTDTATSDGHVSSATPAFCFRHSGSMLFKDGSANELYTPAFTFCNAVKNTATTSAATSKKLSDDSALANTLLKFTTANANDFCKCGTYTPNDCDKILTADIVKKCKQTSGCGLIKFTAQPKDASAGSVVLKSTRGTSGTAPFYACTKMYNNKHGYFLYKDAAGSNEYAAPGWAFCDNKGSATTTMYTMQLDGTKGAKVLYGTANECTVAVAYTKNAC